MPEPIDSLRPKSRAQDTDRHVGARMRQRRVTLGLTQHQMAELIGVTYQQAHKYEKGINRIAAGRLFNIAQALGVDVNYFFEGVERGETTVAIGAASDRWILEHVKLVLRLPSEQQVALSTLVRTIVEAATEKDVRLVPRLVG